MGNGTEPSQGLRGEVSEVEFREERLSLGIV